MRLRCTPSAARLKRIPVRQAFALILFFSALSAALLSDIWILLAMAILGGVVAGGLIFWHGTASRELTRSERIPADSPGSVHYHPGISIHHIPAEGAAGLLFAFATVLIFGAGVPAVRELFAVTAPFAILGFGILVLWHKHHPIEIHAVDLHEHKHPAR